MHVLPKCGYRMTIDQLRGNTANFNISRKAAKKETNVLEASVNSVAEVFLVLLLCVPASLREMVFR